MPVSPFLMHPLGLVTNGAPSVHILVPQTSDDIKHPKVAPVKDKHYHKCSHMRKDTADRQEDTVTTEAGTVSAA